jgi:hypothetical protein
MPYIGKSPVGGGFHKLDNLTASATATYALTLGGAAYYPETANQLLVSLNGVIQAPQDSFTVSGSNLVFDSALTASDSIDFVVALGDVLGVQGVTDGTVTTAKIANQAVTMDKLATSGTLPALDGSALTGIDAGSNILEQLFLNGNGDSVTVSSGTYSLANITAKQALTTTYADITGSSISYTPPAGATQVVYEFNYRLYGVNASIITHFKMYLDSDEITQARKTVGGGGSYDGEHVNHRWSIAIGGSADTASGRVASWTSPKTIKLQGRNYSGTYAGNVHEIVYWDGASSSQVVVPTMQITAYK